MAEVRALGERVMCNEDGMEILTPVDIPAFG